MRGKRVVSFCELPAEYVITSHALAFAIRDKYPVTGLHTLVKSWTRLSEQFFRFDMWSSAGVRLPSGEAAA